MRSATRTLLPVSLCAAIAAPGSLAAQTQRSGDAGAALPSVVAVAREAEIHIDGRLDEAEWRRAAAAGDFVQRDPVEGARAEEPTEVRVLFDDDALYVGARMYDRAPHTIADRLVRRDEEGPYDFFEVSLDPNSDRRTGYLFRVSAAGVQLDTYLYDDVRDDRAWDAVWQSAVQRDSLGWSAELRIPLAQLRYEAADTLQAWGANFSRRRVASNERTFFALESRRRHGRVSVFGRMVGLEMGDAKRRVELRPYGLALARAAPREPGDPFFDGSELGARAGLDLRYGLGAAFTLDLTLNPDFGQVEVDPAVINLTAFETFFPEKRPFFVEDARVFDFNLSGHQNRLFYSRRIGRQPQAPLPDSAEFADVPTETTILGAAKLSGRTAGGLSVGALAAMTARELGRAQRIGEGGVETFVAEPRTAHGVLRFQQDFGAGRSQAGLILTGHHRVLPPDGSFDFLTSSAYSAGLDFEHTWANRAWALWGFLAGSLVQGPNAALVRIQRLSNHYFQRPDAADLSVDSAATALAGAEWRLQLERRSGRHWTGAVWAGEVTPGFEVNDLGFSRSNERLDAGARLSYQEIQPGRVLRSYRISAFTFHNWRHQALERPLWASGWGRAHQRGNWQVNANFTFLNYWDLNLEAAYRPETMSGEATRGGPLMIEPASAELRIRASTDRRKPLSLEPSVNLEEGRRGGSRFGAELEVTWRPTPTWELELSPEYSRQLDVAQYVAATGAVGYAPTYGARYLFADLRRESFSLETRLSVALSPAFSLQAFVQPLLSAGDFLIYKQLARAESFDFDVLEEGTARATDSGIACEGGRTCALGGRRYVDFGGDGTPDLEFGDRDFNVRSLRGNAVLRWEYRPGSVLFLVWQHRRRDEVDDGRFRPAADARALFAAASENVFIIKASYWLGL